MINRTAQFRMALDSDKDSKNRMHRYETTNEFASEDFVDEWYRSGCRMTMSCT